MGHDLQELTVRWGAQVVRELHTGTLAASRGWHLFVPTCPGSVHYWTRALVHFRRYSFMETREHLTLWATLCSSPLFRGVLHPQSPSSRCTTGPCPAHAPASAISISPIGPAASALRSFNQWEAPSSLRAWKLQPIRFNQWEGARVKGLALARWEFVGVGGSQAARGLAFPASVCAAPHLRSGTCTLRAFAALQDVSGRLRKASGRRRLLSGADQMP